MSELTLAQLGVMKAVVARDRSQAGLIAKGLIDYVDLLLTDRDGLVLVLFLVKKHWLRLGKLRNVKGSKELNEAYEALSQELKDEIEKVT